MTKNKSLLLGLFSIWLIKASFAATISLTDSSNNLKLQSNEKVDVTLLNIGTTPGRDSMYPILDNKTDDCTNSADCLANLNKKLNDSATGINNTVDFINKNGISNPKLVTNQWYASVVPTLAGLPTGIKCNVISIDNGPGIGGLGISKDAVIHIDITSTQSCTLSVQ